MKVKLQEVLEALDGAGVDMEYYYDTKNEEILMIFDGMVQITLKRNASSATAELLFHF